MDAGTVDLQAIGSYNPAKTSTAARASDIIWHKAALHEKAVFHSAASCVALFLCLYFNGNIYRPRRNKNDKHKQTNCSHAS